LSSPGPRRRWTSAPLARHEAQQMGICPKPAHRPPFCRRHIRQALQCIDIIDFIYLSHKATISLLRAGLAV
jgi:hypothetical protein